MLRSKWMAAPLCAVLVAAGCGGDDDGDSNQALSYEETGQEISQICASVGDLGSDLTGDPENDAQILQEDVIPEFERAIDEVRELDANEELQAQKDDFVENADRQVEVLQDLAQATEEGDEEQLQDLQQQLAELDDESDDLARELGATECYSDEDDQQE